MSKKVLLITGSNRGAGYGIAKYFYDQGYEIISLNRTLKNEVWLGELKCDLSQPGQIIARCQDLVKESVNIDVCILNAAVRKLSFIEDMPYKDWEDSVATNYSAVFYLLKSLLPIFKSSKTYITVIGSHAATHYFDGGVAYCSTKAALKAMVEVFIQETRDYGIRTTLINAGAINNRPKGNDDKKLQPESIGKCIFSVVNSNSDVLLGELEIRPSIPLKPNESGISKLQYV
ncbi:SDR family NAD(P)-dependent oxidoreductase [Flavivirga rizhaonensis]|uniref:SDR family NAD(P)-dependent oxidoreductase n=1 Tax=Flavivirga rizhaonensis TaxID=2559571 RepID=A0A4S1DU25_9FLAO|nr:SDR family NAD(P)-dependent oxidoreductase [Flavivirga rizhaonensis]TGV01550.1 SDR family NAD(P)-dependent oxidoreductase [Flavivirga rizhaonensis]